MLIVRATAICVLLACASAHAQSVDNKLWLGWSNSIASDSLFIQTQQAGLPLISTKQVDERGYSAFGNGFVRSSPGQIKMSAESQVWQAWHWEDGLNWNAGAAVSAQTYGSFTDYWAFNGHPAGTPVDVRVVGHITFTFEVLSAGQFDVPAGFEGARAGVNYTSTLTPAWTSIATYAPATRITNSTTVEIPFDFTFLDFSGKTAAVSVNLLSGNFIPGTCHVTFEPGTQACFSGGNYMAEHTAQIDAIYATPGTTISSAFGDLVFAGDHYEYAINQVPEASTLSMLAGGLLFLGMCAKRGRMQPTCAEPTARNEWSTA